MLSGSYIQILHVAKYLQHLSTQLIYYTPLVLIGPRREKTCLPWFVNNKAADQPAHTRSLISAFVFRLLESIISRLASNEISIF